MLHHAPEPQIVLEGDQGAVLGPAPAIIHVGLAGAHEDRLGGVREGHRLAVGALEIGMLGALDERREHRLLRADDPLELVERGAGGADDRRHQRHVVGPHDAAEIHRIAVEARPGVPSFIDSAVAQTPFAPTA